MMRRLPGSINRQVYSLWHIGRFKNFVVSVIHLNLSMLLLLLLLLYYCCC